MAEQIERHIDRACGCKLFFTDEDDAFGTRMVWCEEHEQLAAVLRRIMGDFELVLADIAKRERVKHEPEAIRQREPRHVRRMGPG